MRWLVLVAVAGCSAGNDDVVGPFTGEAHRYVVDGFASAAITVDSRQLADDLDGDGKPDNLLAGQVFCLTGGDRTTHASDMIAAGVIASSVEIQANDLLNDPKVGVTYLGADGDPAIVMGGAFVDGSLESNRTRTTRVPGKATVHLPLFADADPSVVELDGMEIVLDPDGRGGFDAVVRGGIPSAEYYSIARAGTIQMVSANPLKRWRLVDWIGAQQDGEITADDLVRSQFIESCGLADLKLAGGEIAVSAGFGVHLSPCTAGTCTRYGPTYRCFDRMLDQDESDVDCGGTKCMPCAGTFACRTASDCSTAACDGGTCRVASCTDGIRDGFESDVDGGGSCIGCSPA